jgi:hypothetical protein
MNLSNKTKKKFLLGVGSLVITFFVATLLFNSQTTIEIHKQIKLKLQSEPKKRAIQPPSPILHPTNTTLTPETNPKSISDNKIKIFESFPALKLVQEAKMKALPNEKFLRRMSEILSNPQLLNFATNSLKSDYKDKNFRELEVQTNMYWIDFLSYGLQWEINPLSPQFKIALNEVLSSEKFEIMENESRFVLAGEAYELLELQYRFDREEFCLQRKTRKNEYLEKVSKNVIIRNNSMKDFDSNMQCKKGPHNEI